LLNKSDDWLERNHMFFQWLFPLTTPSVANIYAPLLNEPTIAALRASQIAQDNLVRCFLRFCAVLGLAAEADATREGGIVVGKSATFEQRKHFWFTSDSHSNARLTRVFTCLKLLGREDLARALYDGIMRLADSEEGFGISEEVVRRWGAV